MQKMEHICIFRNSFGGKNLMRIEIINKREKILAEWLAFTGFPRGESRVWSQALRICLFVGTCYSSLSVMDLCGL